MAEMLVDPALESQILRMVESVTGIQPSLDDNLFERGLVDSLKVVDLILTLEETFELQLAQDEFSFDHLQSVRRIAQWIGELRTRS